MFKKRLWAVLTLLILALPACKTLEVVRELPSPELLRDCPSPVLAYRTNGELAEAIVAWRNALATCNIDKATLREWANEQEAQGD